MSEGGNPFNRGKSERGKQGKLDALFPRTFFLTYFLVQLREISYGISVTLF